MQHFDPVLLVHLSEGGPLFQPFSDSFAIWLWLVRATSRLEVHQCRCHHRTWLAWAQSYCFCFSYYLSQIFFWYWNFKILTVSLHARWQPTCHRAWPYTMVLCMQLPQRCPVVFLRDICDQRDTCMEDNSTSYFVVTGSDMLVQISLSALRISVVNCTQACLESCPTSIQSNGGQLLM